MTPKKPHYLFRTSFLVLIGIHCGYSQYVVDVIKMAPFGEEELVHKCDASGGNFGRDVTDFIMSDDNLGCGVSIVPVDACSPITAAQNHSKSCYNTFAFVSRSNRSAPCKFSHQAYMVQNSTYKFKLAIFFNYADQDPITMDGSDMRDKIDIPVLMISYKCRQEILQKFSDVSGYRLRVRIDPGYYELFRYLIPFLVVIVFCFALFLITLCVRGCVERRKLNKRRLSKRNLKKIPVKKYRLGDDPDTCAICLESFSPGEKLRHLPCRHVFHCKCIDVWLTQTRKVCPLCKRKIGSDSDSECSNSEMQESGAQNAVNNFLNASINQAHTVPTGPVSSRLGEMWSSQEALVDQDIVLAGNANRTFKEYLKNAFRRGQNNQQNADIENNQYTPRQAAATSDTDGLLGNEMSNAPQYTDSQLSTTTEETTITLSETIPNEPNTSTSSFQTC